MCEPHREGKRHKHIYTQLTSNSYAYPPHDRTEAQCCIANVGNLTLHLDHHQCHHHHRIISTTHCRIRFGLGRGWVLALSRSRVFYIQMLYTSFHPPQTHIDKFIICVILKNRKRRESATFSLFIFPSNQSGRGGGVDDTRNIVIMGWLNTRTK